MSALCLMATLSLGCAKSGSDSFCAVAKPVWIADADVLTDVTARQVLEHNETWERLCR